MASKSKIKKINLIEEMLDIKFHGDLDNPEDVETFIDEFYERAADEKEERISLRDKSVHMIFNY